MSDVKGKSHFPVSLPKPVLQNWERNLILDKAFQKLEDIGYAFSLVLFNLGRPVWTSTIDTAATEVEGKRIRLLFNPSFFDWLVSGKQNSVRDITADHQAMAKLEFVIMHEVMHLMLGHVERRGERDPFIWNLAGDVVANAMILNMFDKKGVATRFLEKWLKSIHAATADYLGVRDPLTKTTEEVYEELLKNEDKFKKMLIALLDDCCSGDGKPLDPQTQKALEDLRKILKQEMAGSGQSDDICGSSYGSEPLGEARLLYGEIRKHRLNWDEILANRLMTALHDHVREKWNPARRIYSLYPNVLLPSDKDEEEKKKFKAFVALDASGSIDGNMLLLMVQVVNGMPKDRFEASFGSFDTELYPMAKAPSMESQIVGGGGTSFSCIEAYINDSLPEYPDIVIVMTDGYAASIKPKCPDRWLWLIVPSGNPSAVENVGTHIMIEKGGEAIYA